MKDEINGMVRKDSMVSEIMKKKIKWQAFGKYSKGMEVLSMKTESSSLTQNISFQFSCTDGKFKQNFR